MAERRMFAKTIIDSDAFLDMPATTQILYFHLAMRADDDGFINNPKKIQRMVGCNDDDLKLLAAKKFIIPFESGIVVIKHWKIHNYIQKDRYRPTVYHDEKKQLEVKNNGAYRTLDTVCIQDGHKLDAQVRLGKVRLGKVRLGKVRLGKDLPSPAGSGCAPKMTKEAMFKLFWEAYPKKKSKGQAEKAWNKLKPDELLLKLILSKLQEARSSPEWTRDGGQYIPYPATWLNAKGWEDEYTQTMDVPDAWNVLAPYMREDDPNDPKRHS